MWIVEVRPCEPWPIAVDGVADPRDPAHGGVQHFVRRPLQHRESSAGGPRPVLVVVDVEPGVQPEARIEHESGDERASAVPGCLQRARERGMTAVETKRSVVADAIDEWIRAGQQRCVRGERQRHMGVGRFEAQSLGGEPIDRRRQTSGATVGAHVIRAQGVDGNQQDVRAAQCAAVDRLRRLRAAASHHADAGRDEGETGQDGEDGQPFFHRRAFAIAASTRGMSGAYRARGASRRKRVRYGRASAGWSLSASTMPRLNSRS